MKLYNPIYLLAFLNVVAVSASLFGNDGSTVIDRWSQHDVEQFLRDRGLTYNRRSKPEELRRLANTEWNKVAGSQYSWGDIKQKILDGSPNLLSGSPTLAYDQSYKDWIFDTWSKQDLYKFIHKNNIQFSKDQSSRVLSNRELIDIIKDNWDTKVLKNNEKKKISSLYPGEWLYDTWNTASLKAWLTKHKIEYHAKDSRDELLYKVRKNIYNVSANDYLKNQYNSVKDGIVGTTNSASLYLSEASKEAAKKYKDFKPDSNAFQYWDSDDFKAWLAANKLSTEGSAKDLTNRAYDYYAQQKGHADKNYNKISKAAQEKYNDAQDKYYDATEGVDSNTISNYLFESLYISDLKLWLDQHKQSTEGTVDELYDRAVNTYHGLSKDAEHKKHRFNKLFNKKQKEAQKKAEANKGAAEKTVDKYSNLAADKYNDIAHDYFDDWSIEGLQAWLAEHKQSTEGSAEELYDRSVNTFTSAYGTILKELDNQQAAASQKLSDVKSSAKSGIDSLQVTAAHWWNTLYLDGYNWWYKGRGWFTGEAVPETLKAKDSYLVSPTDSWLTTWYKHAKVNFRYYVLGEHVYV